MPNLEQKLAKLQEMYVDSDYMLDPAYAPIKSMSAEEFMTYERESMEDDPDFDGTLEEYVDMIISDFGLF